MRKYLEIPHELFVSAVKRHDDRVLAIRIDPRKMNKIRKGLRELIIQLHAEKGTELPTSDEFLPRKPLPEIFEPDEIVARDDAIIGGYLSDNPTEAFRPIARGRSISELEQNWKLTKMYAADYEETAAQMKAGLKEIIRERLAERQCERRNSKPNN